MGRPDEQVVLDIRGYKFKEARRKGEVFVTSPGGVNFSFKVDVFEELINTINKDEKTRKDLGL